MTVHVPAAAIHCKHIVGAPASVLPALKYVFGYSFRSLLRPVSLNTRHCAGPARPFLVVTTITPLAACVPYNVAADGPFTTSIDSISSGFRLFIMLGAPVPIPPPKAGDELSMRTPSTMISGSFESDAELMPRIRMRAPPPTLPLLESIDTPARRPLSTSSIDVIGSSFTNDETSTLAIELPSSRVSCWPVAVETTASSWKGTLVNTTSSVVAWPLRVVVSRRAD